jgi:hypothetical protein
MAPESPSYKTQTTIFAFPYEADRFVEGLIERHLLSTAQEQKLVESALRVQRSQVSAWGERLLLTFLGDQELAGKLNDAQRRQFFNQISVKMRARPVGVAGTKLPYTIEFRGRGPEVGWRLDFEILHARIDGKAASIGMYRTGGGFASGASSSVYVSEPGAHSLEFEGQLRIFSQRDIGPNGDLDDATPRMSRDVHLSADFYAFPVDSPDAVDWVTEPSSEVLKRHIQVSRLDSRGDGKQWVLSINLANLPEDIAFKVLARSAGKEFVLGEISGNRGESIGHGIFADNPLPEAKIDRVDIILRSDAAVALDKIDLLVPWKGSLVYESIPVSTDDK